MENRGVYSPDGRWYWNGQAWVPVQAAIAVAPPSAAAPVGAYEPGTTRAFWAMSLIVLTAAFDLLSSIVLVAAGGDQAMLAVGGLLAIVQLLTYIGAAVVFCMWLHRAVCNGPALGGYDLQFTPGWAVGWWFIPFANLFMPYRAVSEVWKVSDPSVGATDRATRSRLSSGPLPAWWAAWIVAGVLGRALVIGQAATSWLSVVASVADLVAAGLAIYVVKELDRRQVVKHARLAGLPNPLG